MSPNLPLFREVAAWLRSEPEEWNQRDFYLRTPCGTTMCVAGYVALRDGAEPDVDFLDEDGKVYTSHVRLPDERTVSIPVRAQELLGIRLSEANQLFYSTMTDDPEAMIDAMSEVCGVEL